MSRYYRLAPGDSRGDNDWNYFDADDSVQAWVKIYDDEHFRVVILGSQEAGKTFRTLEEAKLYAKAIVELES